MKRILFATLPNKKIAKCVCFTLKEYQTYYDICAKHKYFPIWHKDYKTHEEIDKELLK